MAIRFFKFRIKVSINGEVKDKYVPRIQLQSEVGFDQIAEIVEKKSTMSRGDLLGVLAEIETAVLWMVENGHPVKLNLLGSFFPAIEAMAVDSPEEVTAKTIKRFKCIYKPSIYLKKRFKNVDFSLVDNVVKEVKYKRDK
ncbi:MAG: putative DNA-binding protein, histone-like [Bacteroidetes bacterium]|nr:putative DNA-binding protein, histone-like [Bacteroidota bacterium]